MKPMTMLESLIARRTELDAAEIIEDVKKEFFDDQQPIFDEVAAALFTKNFALHGDILADRLKNVIDSVIARKERAASRNDDTPELNRRLHDRNEARAINGR